MAGYNFNRTSYAVPLINTKHRIINTPVPAPGTQNILEVLDTYESRSMHGQLPIVWDKAKDFYVNDIAGNKWIDFTSTIFVTNIGHANGHLKERLKEIIDKDLIHSYSYATKIRATYLKKLIEFTPAEFEKAFLLSAGTEATEAALKLMRLWSLKIGKRKPGIIAFEGNWHGRTMGAQMLSSNIHQKEWIGFRDPNIYHLPFPYPWAMNGMSGSEFFELALTNLEASDVNIETDICGFMLETFQGWGAVFYPPDFVQAIEALCRKYNILLAFDEMQAGFARTGRLFGYQHYEVTPDLICCGKGISSGVPLSAVLGRKEIMDLPEIGDMSSTHSANPLVCAAGLATLEEIERCDLIGQAERKGEILFSALDYLKKKYPSHISYVLGKGLVSALIFKHPETNLPDPIFPSKVSERAMQKGLLVVHTGRESIKIAPPLIIDDDAIIEGVNVLGEAIDDVIMSETV